MSTEPPQTIVLILSQPGAGAMAVPGGVDDSFTLQLCNKPFIYAIFLNEFGPVLNYILTCGLLI